MIYRAHIQPSSYILIVVRAATSEQATELATNAAKEYHPENWVEVLEEYDPDGPEGVLCEDAS